jgi:3-hydroxybutyrate dehydrogenase
VRGLGLAAARRLASAGCNVVLSGFDGDRSGAALAAEIESQHSVRARYSDADLRRVEAIEAMVADGLDAFGAIDILINNAVVRHAAPVESFDTTAWDEGLAVNVSAAFHTIRLTVPSMRRQGWGRIINVSSIYGLRGAINRVNYVTSKTALIGLTRAVALETVRDGITCNAVCPGTTETPVHEAAVDALMTSEGLSQAQALDRVLAGKQPTGRFVAADGVAALMLFLCSHDADDITGAVLPVDGGWAGM